MVEKKWETNGSASSMSFVICPNRTVPSLAGAMVLPCSTKGSLQYLLVTRVLLLRAFKREGFVLNYVAHSVLKQKPVAANLHLLFLPDAGEDEKA